MAEPVQLSQLLRAETFEREQVERVWAGIAVARARRGGRMMAGARGVGAGVMLAATTATIVAALLAGRAAPGEPPQVRAGLGSRSTAATLTRSDGSAFVGLEASDASPARVVLSDGSAVDIEPGGAVAPIELSATRVVLRLQRGVARFAVRPGGPRRWTVEAGPARVEVVGTRFEVMRDGRATRVRVEHGVVRVRGGGLPEGGVQLTRGQALRVDAAGRTDDVSDAAQLIKAPAPLDDGAREKGRAAAVAAPKRETAPATSEAATTTAAPAASEAVPVPGVEALLAEADRLRVGREHAAAAQVLERVLREHAGDPRAALAAFTLGRLREHALADAPGAAAAYAQALALGLAGSLAHDARAHLARSLLAAGQREGALRAAREYLARHPRGADATAMREMLRAATQLAPVPRR